MDRIRRFLRWIFLGLLLATAIAIISGVLGEFFIELAREKGLYANPSQKLDAAVKAFGAFVTHTWFVVATATLAGLTLGLWLDKALRKFEKPKAIKEPLSKDEAMLLYSEIEILKRTLLDDAEDSAPDGIG